MRSFLPRPRRWAMCMLVTAALCSSAFAHADTDRAEIERLVRVSLQSWETGDEHEFLATSHPQFKFAFPGTRTDAQGALDVFRHWRKHFENTKIYVHWILVDGQRFAVEYQFASTQKKDGKRTASSTVAIGEVIGGRIALFKEYSDGRVTRMQLQDELPLDEGEEPYPWPRTHNRFQPQHE